MPCELCRGMVGFAASGPNTRTQQLCLFLGVLARTEGGIHTVLDQGCFQRTVEIAEESKTMVSCLTKSCLFLYYMISQQVLCCFSQIGGLLFSDHISIATRGVPG